MVFALEEGPFFAQSTLFMTIIDLLLILSIFQKIQLPRRVRTTALLAPTIAVAVISTEFLLFSFNDKKNIFADATHTVSYLEECKNKKIQTLSFSRDKRSPLYSKNVHPILIEDASYFGFFQDSILNRNSIDQVYLHNQKMGRKINYLMGDNEICFFDPTVKGVLDSSHPRDYRILEHIDLETNES